MYPMSLKKNYYSLLIVLLCLLISCQDTKKESISRTASSIDSISNPINTHQATDRSNSETHLQKEDSTAEWEPLTTETAPDFLRKYGEENPETKVKIETNLGDMTLKLYEDTPLHRANFIFLVKEGYFDSTTFHRVAKDFIIQAGSNDGRETGLKRNEIGRHYLLPAEINPSRTHRLGSVSGAKQYRDNPGHQTAPFEFFIFVGEPVSGRHLNDSYTIFGEVTEGLDTAIKISELDTDRGEWPIQLIYIKASVID